MDKITETRKCIEDRRSKCTFSLRDQKEVVRLISVCIRFVSILLIMAILFIKERWVEKNKEVGTPLSQWYSRYKTMREREILMEISNKDIVIVN